MSIFDESEIIARDYDGQEIRIVYKNVKNLQEYTGVHTIKMGNVPIAGPLKEFLKIETFGGEIFEIPRTPENDTEILSFLLKKGNT